MIRRNFILTFTLILISSIFNHSYSQGRYINDSVGIAGPASDFDIVAYNYFVNHYDEEVTFIWERIYSDLPNIWESSVCVGLICYFVETNTETFTLDPGDTVQVLAHFYPYYVEGNGNHKVIIYPDKANGIDEADTATFYGFASSPTSLTPEVRKNSLKITRLYPNPVSDILSVQLLSNSNYHIIIYNVLGEKVMDTHISNNNSANISVEHLNNGMYMLSVTDLVSGNKVSRTISKF